MPGREGQKQKNMEQRLPTRIVFVKGPFLSRCPVHIYILAANDNYFTTISCRIDNSGVIGKRYQMREDGKKIYTGVVLDEEGGNYVTSGQAAETEQNDETETLVRPYEWNCAYKSLDKFNERADKDKWSR